MKNILLVGNGPNYFSKGNSWTDVVRNAAKHARIRNEVERLIREPLPYVYERISAEYPLEEHRARQDIASGMRTLKPNSIHEELMALGWTTLTTNYDDCLEVASGERFRPRNLGAETMYSLFRRKLSPTRSVWHIHGDLAGPRTMMLDLHHYAGYLQKVRRYLTTKTEASPFVFGDSRRGVEDVKHSWTDLFLRDHVHIVGLGFGYGELVLWWLLAFKQRLKFRKGLRCGPTTYYQLGDPVRSDKRLELMNGFGAKINYIPSSTGKPTRACWNTAISMLSKST